MAYHHLEAAAGYDTCHELRKLTQLLNTLPTRFNGIVKTRDCLDVKIENIITTLTDEITTLKKNLEEEKIKTQASSSHTVKTPDSGGKKLSHYKKTKNRKFNSLRNKSKTKKRKKSKKRKLNKNNN